MPGMGGSGRGRKRGKQEQRHGDEAGQIILAASGVASARVLLIRTKARGARRDPARRNQSVIP